MNLTIASNIKQTLAGLKNIEAELSALAMNSLDEEAKRAFHETSITMGDVKKDVQTRVYELERQEPQYKGS